jgi:AcrR family transcriptional regulator
MEAVATEANLARSTVYRYFRQKSDLITAVLMRELERFLDRFEAATAALTDPADIAAEGFVVTVRFIRASSVLSELLVSDSEELLPYLTVRGGSIMAVARMYLLQRLMTLTPSAEVDVEAQEQLAETAVRLAMSFIFNRESIVDLDDDTALRAYARRCVAPLGEAIFAAAGCTVPEGN